MNLTVKALESSGYNEAAQDVLCGDQRAAALHVLDRPPIYDDAEDRSVRATAEEALR